MALIVPFGAIAGFTSVALAFTATHNGLSEGDAADIVAFGMAPQIVKFLWAPLADLTFDRKRWYLAMSALCITGVVLMGAIPLNASTISLMKAIVLITNLATSLLGMSVEGMIAHLTPEGERGSVGGWLQAGNLGGSGIGGGLALWLMGALPAPWMSGAVVAVVFAICAIPLYFLPTVPADDSDQGVLHATRALVSHVLDLARSRQTVFAAIISFVPISTGAAMGVLAQSTVAAHWGAGADDVALVNGLLAGFVMALGSFIGGQLCLLQRPRVVYAVVGLVMALVGLGMSVAPPTRMVFIAGGMSYALVTGLAYASWTGLVLEVVGGGAAATKYNIFASLSNFPITYMGVLLGHSLTWGVTPQQMLQLEALAGFVGIAIVVVAARLLLVEPVSPGAAEPQPAGVE